MTKSEFTSLQDNYIAKEAYFKAIDAEADREFDRLLAKYEYEFDTRDVKNLARLNEEMSEFDDKVNNAMAELKKAEQNLLKASIAITPEADITIEQLNNASLKNIAKWLSLALFLDANTIPADKLARA